ncbi:GAF and ANTAR domain-containing protein [Streptomyces sp. NPDC053560]|uniref:GAF and ANTAR domain-containing protein n=1 Tax=Streptomyces sp. NPDC053560 TaxID=3365711 RepID=UPI0037D22649
MPDPDPDPGADSAPEEHEGALARALLNLIQVRADSTAGPLSRRLVSHCLALLPVDAVGVILVVPAPPKDGKRAGSPRKSVQLTAASHEVLRGVELYEIETADGPCMEAVRTGRPHHVADLAGRQRRWRALAVRATAAGYRAMWAEPLRHRDGAVGAINLYCRDAGTLDARHRQRARSLAGAATTGLLLQRTLTDCHIRTGQLQQALSSRVPIEQAKGILAGRFGLSPEGAFEVLRTYARAHQMRLRDLATAVIDDPTGPWPPPEPGRPES